MNYDRNVRDLEARELLSKYKRVVRNPPMVIYASDEEMDEYYNKCEEYENEILRRMENRFV